jgi:hypothetical protein
VVSQLIKQNKLGLIEGLPAFITYSKKAKPTAGPCAHERRGETQRRNARDELPPLHSILTAA